MGVKVRLLNTSSLFELGQLFGIGRDQAGVGTILTNEVTSDGATFVEFEVIVGIVDDVRDLAKGLVLEESGSIVLAFGELNGVKLILNADLFGNGCDTTSASREGSAVNMDSHFESV